MENKKAFTLIELIVVIAIIAVLAAVIAPNAFKAIEKAKVTQAIGDFKTLKTAFYSIYADTGTWGLSNHCGAGACYVPIAGMTEFIQDPGNMRGWDGPYVEKLEGKTPWDGTYVIQTSNCSENPPPLSSATSARDIWLEFEDNCFSGGGSTCGLTDQTIEIMDAKIDDGNGTTGEFRGCTYGGTTNWCYCSTNDTVWVFVHDAW